MGPTVGIFADYKSPLARRVAGGIWPGLSVATLEAGYANTTAFRESPRVQRSTRKLEGSRINVFAPGQDAQTL